MELVKTCNKCNVEKEVSDFYKKPKGLLGVDSRCKKCVLKLKKSNRELKSNNYNDFPIKESQNFMDFENSIIGDLWSLLYERQ